MKKLLLIAAFIAATAAQAADYSCEGIKLGIPKYVSFKLTMEPKKALSTGMDYIPYNADKKAYITKHGDTIYVSPKAGKAIKVISYSKEGNLVADFKCSRIK